MCNVGITREGLEFYQKKIFIHLYRLIRSEDILRWKLLFSFFENRMIGEISVPFRHFYCYSFLIEPYISFLFFHFVFIVRWHMLKRIWTAYNIKWPSMTLCEKKRDIPERWDSCVTHEYIYLFYFILLSLYRVSFLCFFVFFSFFFIFSFFLTSFFIFMTYV